MSQELPEDFKADIREILPELDLSDLNSFHQSLIELVNRPQPEMTDEERIENENLIRERFGMPKRVQEPLADNPE